MAKVKQPFDEERYVPWLGRVVRPGETVDVPDDEVDSYLAGGWQPVGRAAKAAAAAASEQEEGR